MASQLLLEIKGALACQALYYGGIEWVLSMESMLLVLKVPQLHTDTTLEPQWQPGANLFFTCGRPHVYSCK